MTHAAAASHSANTRFVPASDDDEAPPSGSGSVRVSASAGSVEVSRLSTPLVPVSPLPLLLRLLEPLLLPPLLPLLLPVLFVRLQGQ